MRPVTMLPAPQFGHSFWDADFIVGLSKIMGPPVRMIKAGREAERRLGGRLFLRRGRFSHR